VPPGSLFPVSQTLPYGELVAANGLSDSHRAIIAEVPPGSRVLDVGCATGYLAAELNNRGCAVAGVEPDPVAAAVAREHVDPLIEGDVEGAELWPALEAIGPFDVVICGDVLEHLRNPWRTLDQLAALLRPGGLAIISVPNIAHWTARRESILGRFDYQQWGIFDHTHLRFFTRATAHALVQSAGLTVESEHPIGAPLPLQSRVAPLARLAPRALAARPTLFALQYVLVGRRA